MQLCRNNPDITNNSAFKRPIDPPPPPAWVNDLKMTFGAVFLTLSWQAAGRSADVDTQYSLTHNCISMPLQSQVVFRIGHQLGISESCHHCVKFTSNSFWANNLNATTSTHISYSQDAIQNSFYRVSVFFSVIIQSLWATGRKKGLYLCYQASPSSSCSNSWGWLPSLVRQTATVTTVL